MNLIAMGVLFASVNYLARRLAGARAASIAVAICGTMPLLYGLSHWYLVELPPCGGGSAGVRSFVCNLWIANASASLLRRLPKSSGKMWLAGVSCAVVALPWYALNWRAAVLHAVSAGFREEAAHYGTGAVFTPAAIGAYLAKVCAAVSPYYAVCATLSFAGLALFPKRNSAGSRLIPALWALPLILFVFSVKGCPLHRADPSGWRYRYGMFCR